MVQGGVVAVSVVDWCRPSSECLSKATVGLKKKALDGAGPQFASDAAGFRLAWPLVPGRWELRVGQWARVAIERQDMIIQTVPGDGGNVGDSRDLEIQSASVEASQFDGRKFMVAEDVHELGVMLAVDRGSCASRERYFSLDGGKEAANAHDPSVLNVV